jgi:HSP20 family protein
VGELAWDLHPFKTNIKPTMKLIRYHHPLNHTLNELSDWIRDPSIDFQPFSQLLGHRFRDVVSGNSRLAVDLFDAGEHYGARFHLPGLSKEEVKVSLEPNSELIVSYERQQEGEESPLVARASRRVALPEDADVDAVSAKLEDGVLTVTIGKSETTQPRAIEIS